MSGTELMDVNEDAAQGVASPSPLARILNELFNPPWVGVAILGAVAAQSATSVGQFILWWAVAAFFTSLVPMGFLVQAMRKGRVSDWYVTQARERMRPFTIALLSFTASAVVMVIFSAPAALLAVTLSGMVSMIVALAVTPRQKLSIHVGTVSGGVVVLAFVFGPWALLLGLLIPIVGWARIRVAHHTPSQVVLGGLTAAIVSAIVYSIAIALV